MEEPDDIKHILGPKETVGLYIKEKVYHPKVSIDSVVITNERIILRHPHALALKRDYTDYNYSDIEGVEMEKGLLRSKSSMLQTSDAPGISNLPAFAGKSTVLTSLTRYLTPLTVVA